MRIVEFVANYAGYNAGEKAGWADEFADQLVKDGFAKHVKPTAAPKDKGKSKSVNKRRTKPAKKIVKK